MKQVEKKRKKKKIKEIIRLFFKYEVDILPVIDNKGRIKGLLYRNRIIEKAISPDFIDKNVGLILKELKRPEQQEFLNFISQIPDEKIFPVINLKGEQVGEWNKKQLINAYYEVLTPSEDKQNIVDIKSILNAFPFPALIIEEKKLVIKFVNCKLLFDMEIKEEIILGRRIDKFFPDILVPEEKMKYPVVSVMKYNHKDWNYTITKFNMENRNYYLYTFYRNNKLEEKKEERTELMSFDELLKKQEKEERQLIKQTLEKYNWNITQAAKALNIPRQTLQYKITKYGIS